MFSCFPPKKKQFVNANIQFLKYSSFGVLEFFLVLFIENFQRSNFKIAVCKTTGAFPWNEQKIREGIILHPLKKKKVMGLLRELNFLLYTSMIKKIPGYNIIELDYSIKYWKRRQICK